MTETTFYRVRSVADRFQVSVRAVIGWIRAGQLEAVRLSSGQYRVTEEAIKKLAVPVPPDRKPGVTARKRSATGVFVKTGR